MVAPELAMEIPPIDKPVPCDHFLLPLEAICTGSAANFPFQIGIALLRRQLVDYFIGNAYKKIFLEILTKRLRLNTVCPSALPRFTGLEMQGSGCVVAPINPAAAVPRSTNAVFKE
jgi:hypothetical protein